MREWPPCQINRCKLPQDMTCQASSSKWHDVGPRHAAVLSRATKDFSCLSVFTAALFADKKLVSIGKAAVSPAIEI